MSTTDRSAITKIPLNDQILAVLRVWRSESSMYRLASAIAKALGRTQGEVVGPLADLYEAGVVQRYVDGTVTHYRIAEDGRQTDGCCCCCNAKLFDRSRPFCQECAPHFDGRI